MKRYIHNGIIIIIMLGSWSCLDRSANNTSDVMQRDSLIVLFDIKDYSREKIADCLRVLAKQKPKVVALDLIMPDEGVPSIDSSLATAIADIDKIILLASIEESGIVSSNKIFTSKADYEGASSILIDDDNEIKAYLPLYQRERQMLNFAEQIAFCFKPEIINPRFLSFRVNEPETITFLRKPGEFYEFDILYADNAEVHNKIVILGDLRPSESSYLIDVNGEEFKTNSSVIYANIVLNRLR